MKKLVIQKKNTGKSRRTGGTLVRIAACVCCAALIVVLCVAVLPDSGSAENATSLPHIEEIVDSQSTFNILEILPASYSGKIGNGIMGTGSLGYYVAGQEPFETDWADFFAGTVGKDVRQNNAANLLTHLTDAGLLSTGIDTPLTFSGNGDSITYTENYYWELAGATGTADLTGWTALKLSQSETATVKGTFTEAAGVTGYYNGVYDYVLSEGGGYAQKVDLFLIPDSTDTSLSSYYYYQPTFGEVTTDNFESLYGQALYTEANGVYTYYTTLSSSSGLDTSVTYYYVTASGVPTAASAFYDAASGTYTIPAGYYAAVPNADTPFEQVSGGPFKREVTSYAFVAEGTGFYNFVPSDTGYDHEISTDTVYYKGKITNNNWLLSDVFDQDPATSALSVTVKTVTPSELTEEEINSADMISLSAGFTPGASDPTLVNGYATDDLTPELAYDIYYRALHDSCPLLVDYGLTITNEGLNITKLAQMCLMGYDATVTDTNFAAYPYTWAVPETTNYVSKNVYCFGAPFTYSGTDTAQNPATPAFNNPFSDTVVTSGFSAVLSEIRNENFLRRVDNPSTTDLLTEQVTIANSVRYIINYAGQRTVTAKDTIEVLDIEPGNATTTALSKATVLGWLGSDTTYTESDIHITTMSTAEFIGKIEDINETYDLVYLGTSLDGFNTSTDSDGNASTNYNDNAMDGLVYSSIGDSYQSSKYLGGLLQQDYWQNDTSTIDFTNSTAATTYRFSGNDITAEKVTELTNFAQGGYPVVIANDVFNGALSQNLSYFTVTATCSQDDYAGTVTMTATATDFTSGKTLDASYAWYKVGATAVLSTSAEYTFTPADGSDATYYCLATAPENGNTAARSNDIHVTNLFTVTATVDTGTSRSLGSYGGSTSFSANLAYSKTTDIARGETVMITASAVNGAGDAITDRTVSYQWYGSSGGTYFTKIGGSTSAMLMLTPSNASYNSYYCAVSVSGGTRAALTSTFQITSKTTGGPWWNPKIVYALTDKGNSSSGTYQTEYVSYYADLTTAVSGGTATLTVTPKNSTTDAVLTVGDFTYTWYQQFYSWRYGYSYSEVDPTDPSAPNVLSVTPDSNSDTEVYYCRVDPPSGSDYATTYKVTVSRGGNISAVALTSGASDGSYQATVYSTAGGVNTARVDSTSYVYRALNAIKDRDNVMSVQEIDAATLQKYLNLSKPKINLTEFPTEYENTDGTMTSIAASADGNYYLNYTFAIENETDPTPATTTYDCALYLDLNADGKYSDSEKLSDITVTQNGKTVYPSLNADGSEYYQLSAGVSYSISRQVPTDYTGILPWKLEIVKNGSPRTHASVHQYTRVAPTEDEAETIKVLQIAPDADGVLNLEAQQVASNTGYSDLYSSVTGKYYAGIYGKLLADVTDFHVQITTVKATALENQFSSTPEASRRAAIYTYLDSFNMVIIGFNDMYGEIGKYTAYAITDYIASGKSILFTHDTTSLSNIDKSMTTHDEYTYYGSNYQQNLTLSSDPSYWGYNFNTIIRDSVGLDRYGISSQNTIKTSASSDALSTIKSILFPQTSSTTLNSTEISSLVSAGYSIAYQANSNADGSDAETLAQTQGYTNYSLIRYGASASSNLKYRNSTYDSGRETTYVSQVNEGQITTYPYNINTAAFLGTGTSDTMSVGKTHEQYYQLNMNSDDIVVWFCLSASSTSSNAYYNDLPNDVVNAYYIYNKGNVTYSGVGHTSANSNYTGGSISAAIQNEAKLFINTMIASYQSGKQDPEVNITSDVNGTAAVNYKYFYSDYTTDQIIEGSTAGNSNQRAIYFRLTDTNLDADKVISLSFTYNSGGEDVTFSPTVYLANGTVTTAFNGGKVYCIYLPDEVLNAMNEENVNSVTVTVHVTTTIDGVARTGQDSIELRKVDLFQLK